MTCMYFRINEETLFWLPYSVDFIKVQKSSSSSLKNGALHGLKWVFSHISYLWPMLNKVFVITRVYINYYNTVLLKRHGPFLLMDQTVCFNDFFFQNLLSISTYFIWAENNLVKNALLFKESVLGFLVNIVVYLIVVQALLTAMMMILRSYSW